MLDATSAARELADRKEERRVLAHKRATSLQRLTALREERFQIRKQVGERLTRALAPTVRVRVEEAADRGAYEQAVKKGAEGARLRAALLESVARTLRPEDLAELVEREDHERLASRSGIDVDHARKIIEALRRTEALWTIQTIDVGDVPAIELLDVDVYKSSSQLSTGQRCTTILPILLEQSERPLLIDQPEDNLDNKYIYDTVVRDLRNVKTRRQLIFVTHNPNVPVLADCERVLVMDSDGKQGRLVGAGTVDERKEDVVRLLEGGGEAFKKRSEKYGY